MKTIITILFWAALFAAFSTHGTQSAKAANQAPNATVEQNNATPNP